MVTTLKEFIASERSKWRAALRPRYTEERLQADAAKFADQMGGIPYSEAMKYFRERYPAEKNRDEAA